MKLTRETFSVAGFHYLIEFGDTGNIAFQLTNPPRPNNAREKYAFPTVVPGTDDLGIQGLAAIAVFREVERRTLNWVYSQKPYTLHFYPSTKAKESLYSRLARKLNKRVSAQYSMAEVDGGYYYYRRLLQ
jgi:hypothetical protein